MLSIQMRQQQPVFFLKNFANLPPVNAEVYCSFSRIKYDSGRTLTADSVVLH